MADIEDVEPSNETEQLVETIKEQTVNISFAETSRVTGYTSKINGVLHSIILTANKLVDVRMYLKKYPSITLFEYPQYVGTYYLPLRTITISEYFEKANFTNDKWVLNDEIAIEIGGGLNTEVEAVFRYT